MQAGLQGRSNATLLAAVIGTSVSTALLTLLSGMSSCHCEPLCYSFQRPAGLAQTLQHTECCVSCTATCPKVADVPAAEQPCARCTAPYNNSASLPTLTPKPHAWRAGMLGFLLLRRPRQKRLAADAEGCGGTALSSVDTPMPCSFSSGAGTSSPEAKKAAMLQFETPESSERLVRLSFAEGGASSPEAKRAAQRHLRAPDGPGNLIGSSDEAPKATPRCVHAPQEGLAETDTRISGGSSLSGAGGALSPKAKEVVSSPEPMRAAPRRYSPAVSPETLAGCPSVARKAAAHGLPTSGSPETLAMVGPRSERAAAARVMRTQDSPDALAAPSTPDQASAKHSREREKPGQGRARVLVPAGVPRGTGKQCAAGAPRHLRRNSSTSAVSVSPAASDADMSIARSGAMDGWDAACNAAAAAVTEVTRMRTPPLPGLPSGSAAVLANPGGTPARASSSLLVVAAPPAGRSPFEAAAHALGVPRAGSGGTLTPNSSLGGGASGVHCGRAKSTLTPATMAPNGSPFAAVLHAPAGPGDAFYAPPAGGRPLTLQRGRSAGENELAAAVRPAARLVHMLAVSGVHVAGPEPRDLCEISGLLHHSRCLTNSLA